MVQPKRVGHVVLNVNSIKESTAFYTNILGFQISKQTDTATFLTCGKIHHDLALFKSRIPYKTKDGLGLNHIAIQVEDFDALTEYHHLLELNQIKIDRTTDHGMTSSIYLNDPDGNGVELFCNNQDDPEEGLEIMSSPDRKNKELVFAKLNSF